MCSGFIVAATNNEKNVLKNQMADEQYYEARCLSCTASATVEHLHHGDPERLSDGALAAGRLLKELGLLSLISNDSSRTKDGRISNF